MLIDILFLFLKLIKYHNYQFKYENRCFIFHSHFNFSFDVFRIDRKIQRSVVDNADQIMVMVNRIQITHFLKCQNR